MTRAVLLLVGLCAFALCACGANAPCAVPGVATQCSCAGGGQGARACLPSRRWSACDCSGRIPLPNAVGPSTPSSGAGSGAGAGGMSGMSAAGSGQSGHGGSGGSTTPPPATDGGMQMTMPPEPDATVEADATMPPEPDAQVDSGPPEPKTPYHACMQDGDCGANALCVQTASIPNAFTVCAPACTTDSDCPKPAGNYEAVVSCLLGYCGLDCTPILFNPLLSCPTGMTCVSGTFGNALCHDDGM